MMTEVGKWVKGTFLYEADVSYSESSPEVII
jgi:hypothetical protein